MRKILLLEPNYNNKYPPIGLMKLATYHRMLGDEVTFYKGEMKQFVVDQIYQDCLEKITKIQPDVVWYHYEKEIKFYIKTKRKAILAQLSDYSTKDELTQVFNWASHYYRKKKYQEEPKWDRVFVTTLFTFYWKKTVETIHFAKVLVKDTKDLMVGGVMASLLTDEIEEETGIKPFKGLLDKPGILDDNHIIIDDLPLDYSILDEVDYNYPTGSAYFTFMTKGCTRKCAFCSVPILEPIYKEKVETIDKFDDIRNRYGEQQHLLLMDNNVLASPKFSEIIDEIKEMGFYNGATYVEPNQYEIAIKNLKEGYNDKAFTNRIYGLLWELRRKRVRRYSKVISELDAIFSEYQLLDKRGVTKANLLNSYNSISPLYEKYRDKSPKRRYVDFNQGTDARYVTEELMKKMSEIPIHPLRIAFDYIGMRKQYTSAVRLAAKYGIKKLSNYLLYNFKDKPEDLYNRMLINIDLAEELNLHIFSFPMKYIPLFGEDAKSRDYLGKHWNKKFIRAIQSVLNVSKGIVASGRSFFERAFGKDLDEFHELLYMPETYIVYRKVFDETNLSGIWRKEFRAIRNSGLWDETREILEKSDFSDIDSLTSNRDIKAFLGHYIISRKDVKEQDVEIKRIRKRFNNLIRNDRFVELTLTYDFE